MELVGLEDRLCEFWESGYGTIYIVDSERGPDVVWARHITIWNSLNRRKIPANFMYEYPLYATFGKVVKILPELKESREYDVIYGLFEGVIHAKYIIKKEKSNLPVIKKWYLKLNEEKIMITFWMTNLDIIYL